MIDKRIKRKYNEMIYPQLFLKNDLEIFHFRIVEIDLIFKISTKTRFQFNLHTCQHLTHCWCCHRNDVTFHERKKMKHRNCDDIRFQM